MNVIASPTVVTAARPAPPSLAGALGPIDWLDRYTRPRKDTHGDLHQNSYIQPMFHAIPAGFAFMGVSGVATASVASLASTFAQRKTGSRIAAFAAGASTGAAMAAGLGALTGPVGVAQVVGGGLLGGIQAFRGDREACVRDSSGNATLLTGLFLPGMSKLAGAVGSGVGSSMGSEASVAKKALVGAASAAVVAVGMTALGMAPAGPALTVGLSAAAGAVGPMFGPRFSQAFRNLAEDSGNAAVKGLHRLGVPQEKLNEDVARNIGAFPSQFLKEGLRGLINSDFEISAMLVGGAVESFELMELFWEQKRTPEDEHSHGHHH